MFDWVYWGCALQRENRVIHLVFWSEGATNKLQTKRWRSMSECDSEEFASCDWLWGLPFVGPRPQLPWSCTETVKPTTGQAKTNPVQSWPALTNTSLNHPLPTSHSWEEASSVPDHSQLSPSSVQGHPCSPDHFQLTPANPHSPAESQLTPTDTTVLAGCSLSSWGKWLIELVGFGWGMMSPPQARIRNSPESPWYISTSTDEHKVSVTWSLYTCARYISKQDVFTQEFPATHYNPAW